MNARIEAARAGICHQARECEDALRLAAFADSEPMLGSGMAESLRRLAAYHSDQAYRWSDSMQRHRQAVPA